MTEGDHRDAPDHAPEGYEILRELGRGAMSTVFLARQLSVHRRVALKVLSRSLSKNRRFVERFEREVRAAARLSHPNIVQAIDVGHDEDYHYLAMEYVDGPSLRRLLEREGPLPEDQALEIARHVALALEHAHTHAGIIHRDVKPANVLITRDGVPKLADLGLARDVVGDDSAVTRAGTTVGTPNYISPEQVRGQTDLDGRTDVYSLGATLYHLLTGERPYSGATSAEVMARHLTDPVPDPRAANPKVSPGAAAVIRRAMAKDREHRYPTAQALADGLDRLLQSRAEDRAAGRVRRPATRKLRAVGRRRRSRPSALPWVIAVAVIAVVPLVGWLVLSTGGSPDAPPRARTRLEEPRPVVRRKQEPSKKAPRVVPEDPIPEPEPEPETPPEPPAVEKKEPPAAKSPAEVAFEQARAEAGGRAAKGDYTGALAVLDELPPEVVNELGASLDAERKRLQADAEKRIQGVVDEARSLAEEDKPDGALDALETLGTVNYPGLRERLEPLRGRLREQAEELAARAAAERRQARIRKNRELAGTYAAKCAELKEQEVAEIKKKVFAKWGELEKKEEQLAGRIEANKKTVLDAKKDVDRAKDRRDDAKDDYEEAKEEADDAGDDRVDDARDDYRRARREYRRARDRYNDVLDDEGAQIKKDRHELAGVKSAKLKLKKYAKAFLEHLDSREAGRKRRVSRVYVRIRDALFDGREIPVEQMERMYRAALELK
ncbi:MAG: serine/threonine-protein kinase [Planctomycetota bacterium]